MPEVDIEEEIEAAADEAFTSGVFIGFAAGVIAAGCAVGLAYLIANYVWVTP